MSGLKSSKRKNEMNAKSTSYTIWSAFAKELNVYQNRNICYNEERKTLFSKQSL